MELERDPLDAGGDSTVSQVPPEFDRCQPLTNECCLTESVHRPSSTGHLTTVRHGMNGTDHPTLYRFGPSGPPGVMTTFVAAPERSRSRPSARRSSGRTCVTIGANGSDPLSTNRIAGGNVNAVT